MKKIFVVLLITILHCCFGQDSLIANKEHISQIRIGHSDTNVQYLYSEEGFFSPEGPMVSENGELLFYPSTTRDMLISYDKGEWKRIKLFEVLLKTTGNQILFISQQGYINVGKKSIIASLLKVSNYFAPDKNNKIEISSEYHNYPLPNGSIMQSVSPPFIYSTEYLGNGNQQVRKLQETRKWLLNQPGGFFIGDDGLLYRNGFLWSALSLRNEWSSSVYIGKLISGHNLFAAGWRGQERKLLVTNANGLIELIIDIPWAFDPNSGSTATDFNMFNYGIGPWGEVYYLIPPVSMWTHNIDEYGGYVYNIKPLDQIFEPAELVVVRNHLKYFGRLNIDAVRLRKEPNTTSEILGTYPAKTGFRILEKGTTEETIGGHKNVWYKVRLLDGKEGYFFGAFVQNLYDGPNGLPPPWPNVPDW